MDEIVCRENQSSTKPHVNGWPIIARHLALLHKRQGDLAQLLQISCAAISQLKSGLYQLNPAQLDAIIEFLRFDNNAVEEFYTELSNARLTDNNGMDGTRFEVTLNSRHPHASTQPLVEEVPFCGLSLLADYESVLEPLTEYISRRTPETFSRPGVTAGMCALRVEPDGPLDNLGGDSIILIDCRSYVAPGRLALLRMRNGRFLLREFRPEKERILFSTPFRSMGRTIIWNRHKSPGLVTWMYPVTELIMKIDR